MKITREICGCELQIDLTPEEILDAYYEQERIFEKSNSRRSHCRCHDCRMEKCPVRGLNDKRTCMLYTPPDGEVSFHTKMFIEMLKNLDD